MPHGLKVHGVGWYIGFREMQGRVRGLLAQVLPFTGDEIKRAWRVVFGGMAVQYSMQCTLRKAPDEGSTEDSGKGFGISRVPGRLQGEFRAAPIPRERCGKDLSYRIVLVGLEMSQHHDIGLKRIESNKVKWLAVLTAKSDGRRKLGSWKKKGCRSGSSGGNGSKGGSGGSGDNGGSGSGGCSSGSGGVVVVVVGVAVVVVVVVLVVGVVVVVLPQNMVSIWFFSNHIAPCPVTGTCFLRQVSWRVLRTAGSEDADGEPPVLSHVQFSSDRPEPCLSAGLRGHVEKGSGRASSLHEGLGGSDEGRKGVIHGDQSLESLLFHHLGS